MVQIERVNCCSFFRKSLNVNTILLQALISQATSVSYSHSRSSASSFEAIYKKVNLGDHGQIKSSLVLFTDGFVGILKSLYLG